MITPVLIAGIMIEKNERTTPQPSILAASSRDVGTPLKYGLSVTTINGIDPEEIASAGPKYVPKRPILLKIKYMGVSIREAGIIWVTRKASRKPSLPGTLYRPIPYAVGTPKQIEIVIDSKAIRQLFLKEHRKSLSEKFLIHGSSVNVWG